MRFIYFMGAITSGAIAVGDIVCAGQYASPLSLGMPVFVSSFAFTLFAWGLFHKAFFAKDAEL